MAYIVRADLTTWQRIGLAVTVGFIAGLGINTAHELGHKRESVERWIAKVALAQSFYGHFYIEHNRGHHVRVATPADPASSRMGENFYQFWPRTVAGSAKSAWSLEVKRLARRGKSPWSLRNDVVSAWLMSAALFTLLILWLGLGVVPYLILQAVVGFTLLEAVNYLEHYGLLRKRVGVGEYERYERVEPRHSWNSNNVTTNVLLYHLQRHSDHHTNPTRRYQALQDPAEAPALPTGYAGMILLALVPWLWRRVMDPRVIAHLDGDVSRANVSPRKRQQIIDRYSSATTHTDVPLEGTSVIATAVEDARIVHCPGCGYVYDVARGDEHEGFAPGTPWSAIPTSWVCPDCGVRDKLDFVVVNAE
jgi:alkane 1-monooxygenase